MPSGASVGGSELEELLISFRGEMSGLTGELNKAINDSKRSGEQAGSGYAQAFQRAMGNIKGAFSNLSAYMRTVTADSNTLAVGMGVVATGFLGAVTAAVRLGGELEQTRIGFTTLLKSEEAADAFLRELTRFASSTPFELKGLRDQAQQLMTMGFAAKDVIPTLRAVGDAAAAKGKPEALDRIVYALGQIQAKGKASAEEIGQQLGEIVPAWKYISEALGKSQAETMKMVAKGQVDAATTIKAILDGMNKDFGGMMEKQSKTLLGQLSNTRDFATSILETLGTRFNKAFDLTGIVTRFNEGLQAIRDGLQTGKLPEWLGDMKEKVIVLGEAIAGALTPALLGMARSLGLVLLRLAPWAAAGVLVVGALQGMGVSMKDFIRFLSLVGQAVQGGLSVFQGLVDAVIGAGQAIGAFFKNFKLGDYFKSASAAVSAAMSGDLLGAIKYYKEAAGVFEKASGPAMTASADRCKAAGTKFADGFLEIGLAMRGELSDSGKAVEKFAGDMQEKLGQFTKALGDSGKDWKDFANTGTQTTTQASGPAEKLASALSVLRDKYEANFITAKQYAEGLKDLTRYYGEQTRGLKEGTKAWSEAIGNYTTAKSELEKVNTLLAKMPRYTAAGDFSTALSSLNDYSREVAKLNQLLKDIGENAVIDQAKMQEWLTDLSDRFPQLRGRIAEVATALAAMQIPEPEVEPWLSGLDKFFTEAVDLSQEAYGEIATNLNAVEDAVNMAGKLGGLEQIPEGMKDAGERGVKYLKQMLLDPTVPDAVKEIAQQAVSAWDGEWARGMAAWKEQFNAQLSEAMNMPVSDALATSIEDAISAIGTAVKNVADGMDLGAALETPFGNAEKAMEQLKEMVLDESIPDYLKGPMRDALTQWGALFLNETSNSAAAMADYGRVLDQTAPKAENWRDVLLGAAQAAGEDSVLWQILGEGLDKLNEQVIETSDSYADYGERLRQTGQAGDDSVARFKDWLEPQKDLAKGLEELKGYQEDLQKTLGYTGPYFKQIEALTALKEKYPQWADEIDNMIAKLRQLDAEAARAEGLKSLADDISKFSGMAQDAFNAFSGEKSIGQVISGLSGVVGAISDAIAPGTGPIASAITQALGFVVDGVANMLDSGWGKVQDGIKQLGSSLKIISQEVFDQAVEKYRESYLFGLINVDKVRINEKVAEFVKTIADALEGGITSGMRSGLQAFFDGKQDWQETLKQGFRNAIVNAIIEAVIQGAIVKGALGNLLTQLTEAISKGDYAGAGGLIGQIGQAAKAVGDQLAGALSGLRDALNAAFPPAPSTTPTPTPEAPKPQPIPELQTPTITLDTPTVTFAAPQVGTAFANPTWVADLTGAVTQFGGWVKTLVDNPLRAVVDVSGGPKGPRWSLASDLLAAR